MEVLTGKEALRALIPLEDRKQVTIKQLNELAPGDHIEGVGPVVGITPEGVPLVRTRKGIVAADKRPLDYPVTVVKMH